MNKKLVYLFVVLVAGLFAVSACEQAVGRRVVNRDADDEEIQGDLQAQQVVLGGGDNKVFAQMNCVDNGGNGFDVPNLGHRDYMCTITCEDGQTFKVYGNYAQNDFEAEYGISDAVQGCKRRGSS